MCMIYSVFVDCCSSFTKTIFCSWCRRGVPLKLVGKSPQHPMQALFLMRVTNHTSLHYPPLWKAFIKSPSDFESHGFMHGLRVAVMDGLVVLCLTLKCCINLSPLSLSGVSHLVLVCWQIPRTAVLECWLKPRTCVVVWCHPRIPVVGFSMFRRSFKATSLMYINHVVVEGEL